MSFSTLIKHRHHRLDNSYVRMVACWFLTPSTTSMAILCNWLLNHRGLQPILYCAIIRTIRSFLSFHFPWGLLISSSIAVVIWFRQCYSNISFRLVKFHLLLFLVLNMFVHAQVLNPRTQDHYCKRLPLVHGSNILVISTLSPQKWKTYTLHTETAEHSILKQDCAYVEVKTIESRWKQAPIG